MSVHDLRVGTLQKQLELAEVRLRGAEREIVLLRRENSALRQAQSRKTGVAPSKVLELQIVPQNIHENIPESEEDDGR